MRPTLTLALIQAAARDAGNTSMRRAGRTVWSAEDASAAWGEYDRLADTQRLAGESLEDCIIRLREGAR